MKRIYSVACRDCKGGYTQAINPKHRLHGKPIPAPSQCGICGSRNVLVKGGAIVTPPKPEKVYGWNRDGSFITEAKRP